MRSKWVVTTMAGLTVVALGLSAGVGRAQQPGVAEQFGEKLDNVGRGIVRGAQDVSDSVRKRFDTVRSEVSRMGVQPRVYSRLHWDKTLSTAHIEVHMLRDGVVLLRGTVPDAAAKAHAVALARDTRDVTGVVDELETVIPANAPAPAPAPAATSHTANPPVLTVPSLSRPVR
jgi:osmotically-inducible protein OsmY